MAHPTEAQVGDGRSEGEIPSYHPRASACLCGSKVRSTLRQKERLFPHPRPACEPSAVQKCDTYIYHNACTSYSVTINLSHSD